MIYHSSLFSLFSRGKCSKVLISLTFSTQTKQKCHFVDVEEEEAGEVPVVDEGEEEEGSTDPTIPTMRSQTLLLKLVKLCILVRRNWFASAPMSR